MPRRRFNGVYSHIIAHWPSYLLVFGGGAALCLGAALWSAGRGLWAYVLLALALLLVLSFYLIALLWAAHQQYDTGELNDVLFELGKLGTDEQIVHIDLGRRLPALALAQRLNRGRLHVVDIYNPQLTPSPSLRRWRNRPARLEPDPRLRWLEGSFDMLPWPDDSIAAVTLTYTAAYFLEHGDRVCLIKEIERILAPGGRLLLGERVRSQTNFLIMGPLGWRLATAAYWRRLLADAGLQVRQERSLQGIVRIFMAEKPPAINPAQLSLRF